MANKILKKYNRQRNRRNPKKTNSRAAKWLKNIGHLDTSDQQTIDYNNDVDITDIEMVDFNNDTQINNLDDNITVGLDDNIAVTCVIDKTN